MPIRKGEPVGTTVDHRSNLGFKGAWGVLLAGLLGAAFGASLVMGSMETTLSEVSGALLHRLSMGTLFSGIDQRVAAVVWEIRLPRALAAAVVGMALAAAGGCLQGLFRNPLADPGLIGVSSGGAIGAILAIGGLGWIGNSHGGWMLTLQLPLWSMAGAMLTTFTVYRIARIAGKTHISTLLLAGIAVNAFAGAIVGSILYLSDNDALRQFTFWTLGSLHTMTWGNLGIMAPFIVFPVLVLPHYRGALNAFLLGEAEAYHLGFNTQWTKRIVIGLCALMVGATVAFCGLIGFVGLVVPHLVRMIWGPDFRRLLPGSLMLGALLMLIADLLARTLNAPAEIPIGVVTSLVGAPFFLYLIYRRKRQLSV